MGISQKTKNRLDELTATLKENRALSLNERDDYIEILAEAAAGTNGLTVEEKTQANSVNIFNLCYLVIRDKLEGAAYGGFWPSLFRLIERCSWQIVIIVLGAFVLFGYRPQIAESLNNLLGR